VSPGIFFDYSIDLVTEAAIEFRRLKAMCGEENLEAAARPRFALECQKQLCSIAPTARVAVYPQLIDIPASSPRPPIDAGDDMAICAAYKASKFLSIVDLRRGEIELVDTIVQELDILRRRPRFDAKIARVHSLAHDTPYTVFTRNNSVRRVFEKIAPQTAHTTVETVQQAIMFLLCRALFVLAS
jgi:hypothetical protein